jgi:CheY-like chemotaxis protein
MNDKPLILLVEDNPNDELLALRALKQSTVQCSVAVAHDGIEALEFLFDVANPIPELVLLDLKLPRMRGLEVLKRIRAEERTRRVPVVLFTSSNQPSDILNCFDSGANSFVRKPMDFNEYLECLAKVAEYWLMIHQSSK